MCLSQSIIYIGCSALEPESNKDFYILYNFKFSKHFSSTWATAMIPLTIGKDGKNVQIYLTILDPRTRFSLFLPRDANDHTTTGAIAPT